MVKKTFLFTEKTPSTVSMPWTQVSKSTEEKSVSSSLNLTHRVGAESKSTSHSGKVESRGMSVVSPAYSSPQEIRALIWMSGSVGGGGLSQPGRPSKM